jgi:uncharacterized protein
VPPLQPSCAFAPNQRLRPSRRWRVWLFGILLGLLVFLPGDPALALSAGSFPELPPTDHVIDQAGILSRAASGEVSRQLEVFSAERIEARLVTVNQLDYGLSLAELGQQLLQRWPEDGDRAGQVIFLIDSQTNAAAVVASPALAGQLNPDLLRSTARTTMAQPIREGARFRQASLDGINRILAVLQGGDDPGEPVLLQVESQPTNIPTRDETASSNAFTWVVVLLVVGTVVPMATWWVFSR